MRDDMIVPLHELERRTPDVSGMRNGVPIISLAGVSRTYGEGSAMVHALAGIDLDLQDGEFVVIMGASGSGKSTCLNVLSCLDMPTQGTYTFKGVLTNDLDRDQLALLRRHYLGFIFQGFNLLGRTSALENVEMPLLYRGLHAKRRHELAWHALELVGLADRAKHMPNELSGGQQQRVAIARALVTNPTVILADEPTGNLDSVMSGEIMGLLKRLNEDHGITVIMVTHEPEFKEYASHLVVFRDGHIIDDRLSEA